MTPRSKDWGFRATNDRPPRILIVDDEIADRSILEALLSTERFDISTAATGEQALAMIEMNAPDLVLLDVMMPEMDGFAVLAAMKGANASKGIPVIMVTTRDDRPARIMALTAGADDFLSKPVDGGELRVRIRNHLRLKAYADYTDELAHRLEREVKTQTAALREERDRAQRYFDAAEVMLIATDLDSRVTVVNRFGCSILGWTAGELIGKDFIDTCIPAADRSALRDGFKSLVAGDVGPRMNSIVTRGGEERMIEWRNQLLTGDDGDVTGVLSCGTDVTDRNLAGAALRHAEERMRFALAAANVGVWEMSHATGVVRWSEIIEAQYGLPPGGFSGKFEQFAALIHPEDLPGVLKTIDNADVTGGNFTVQHRVVWPDGTVRWLNGAGRVELDSNNKPTHAIGVSIDITDRRARDVQSQQAHKMEAVGRLASGVAHDFNNLLTVILGFADLISSDAALPRASQNDVAEIVKAAKRATTLTKQLLAFGRQQMFDTAAVDVNNLITEMAGMVERLVGDRIHIRTIFESVVCTALADRGQIEQVMMNLLVNARDAMPDGGEITIETSQQLLHNFSFADDTLLNGNYVVLGVTDTGEGMSRDTQQQLFEPFFTTKAPGKGTGLGLATTYGIVKQSKGEIRVVSEIGLGTTFTVFLPCSARPESETAVPATAPVPRIAVETILLVEDQCGVRELTSRILAKAGYNVLEASNGVQGESVYSDNREKIDIVVTDMLMPEMGGLEMIARLRLLDPKLRVLYMSGYSESAVSGEHTDGAAFVQKPFAIDVLLRAVRAELDRTEPLNVAASLLSRSNAARRPLGEAVKP